MIAACIVVTLAACGKDSGSSAGAGTGAGSQIESAQGKAEEPAQDDAAAAQDKSEESAQYDAAAAQAKDSTETKDSTAATDSAEVKDSAVTTGAAEATDSTDASGTAQAADPAQEAAVAARTGQTSVSDAIADAADAAAAAAEEEAPVDHIDYQVLVNKLHPLPKGWEDALQTVHMTNSVGDDVEVEAMAYDFYQQLKADLESEGIYIDLDSAYRSVGEQQRIWDDFTEKYGADYTRKTVAVPGYSEHHTGLALDLFLIVDGEPVVENEDLVKYTDIWEKIHRKLRVTSVLHLSGVPPFVPKNIITY